MSNYRAHKECDNIVDTYCYIFDHLHMCMWPIASRVEAANNIAINFDNNIALLVRTVNDFTVIHRRLSTAFDNLRRIAIVVDSDDSWKFWRFYQKTSQVALENEKIQQHQWTWALAIVLHRSRYWELTPQHLQPPF